MSDKPLRPHPLVDEGFEDFKRTVRKVATRPHPLPSDLTRALKAKAGR